MMTLEERRGSLQDEIEIEQKVAGIRSALSRNEAVAELALITFEQAMPYLLHCENRVNEKFFHVLLQHGMRRYGDADSVKRTSFTLGITKVMMGEVLGKLTNPAQWRFPLSQDKKSVERENVANTRKRTYIDGLDAVICCVFGQELDENELRTTRDTNAG